MRYFLLFMICAAFAIAILNRLRLTNPTEPRDERKRVPCDRCAELILPEAKVCHYCGAERIIIRANQS